jgi:hypothetical protein
MTNCFTFTGAGISGYWLSRTLKTVRRIILRKGGKHVTIVTYGLFGPYSRSTTVPVQHVRFKNRGGLIFWSSANIFFVCVWGGGTRATLLRNQELKITLLHGTQVDYVQKYYSRVRQKTVLCPLLPCKFLYLGIYYIHCDWILDCSITNK